MADDLSPILRDWPYLHDQISVRLIRGDDNKEKIQLRVDLGLLQMELDGRPDGQRPEGHESWLDYYEHQQRQYETRNPDEAPFLLGDEDCVRLWREGVQYYHRYLSCWHLDLYDLCARDTARNLRLFAFVRRHTRDDRVKIQFDQWRPYVTMMHTRAIATPLLAEVKYREAFEAIEAGIEAIRDFLEEYRQADHADQCVELASLEQWRNQLLERQEALAEAEPKTAVQLLRHKLSLAVANEQFEEAAQLRDEIRRLTQGS